MNNNVFIISDIKERETFRHHSYVSFRADKEIIGKGTNGYILALEWIIAQHS